MGVSLDKELSKVEAEIAEGKEKIEKTKEQGKRIGAIVNDPDVKKAGKALLIGIVVILLIIGGILYAVFG